MKKLFPKWFLKKEVKKGVKEGTFLTVDHPTAAEARGISEENEAILANEQVSALLQEIGHRAEYGQFFYYCKPTKLNSAGVAMIEALGYVVSDEEEMLTPVGGSPSCAKKLYKFYKISWGV